MTGNERDVRIEQSANRILHDDHAMAAYARFVDAQLRYHLIYNVLAGLRALGRIVLAAAVAFLSACVLGTASGPAPGEGTPPGSPR
jgi:hypothetical protein